jgi:hypothetical protein
MGFTHHKTKGEHIVNLTICKPQGVGKTLFVLPFIF